jgi:hypothetical protein
MNPAPTKEIPRRSPRRWLIAFVLGVTCLAVLFHLAFDALLPIEQHLGSERSPDGVLIAEYSWRFDSP